LTASFKILIEKIWPEEGRSKKLINNYYEPYDFKNKISAMDPLFISYSTKDAKDLVNFIVVTLNNELNEANENYNNLNNFPIVDQRNQLESFRIFFSEFKNRYNSLIINLFSVIKQTQKQCLNCKTIQYFFQNYFFLIFPLEEVKIYTINKILNEISFSQNELNNMFNMNNNINFNRNNNMNFNMNNNMINNVNNNINNIQNNINLNINVQIQKLNKLSNLNKDIVNIYDCFDYNQKIDMFSGNNAKFCNYCQQNTNSNYCTTLLTLPKVLILLFNREKKNEFKIKLEFIEILNLNEYAGLKNSNDNKNDNIYKLIGIITYIGNNEEDGHFIAHCLSPIDNEWYTYNDAIVNKISDLKTIIDFGMPYILFYHK